MGNISYRQFHASLLVLMVTTASYGEAELIIKKIKERSKHMSEMTNEKHRNYACKQQRRDPMFNEMNLNLCEVCAFVLVFQLIHDYELYFQ